MKIRNILLADAANASADGKQNILGAGVRKIFAFELPARQPLTLFVSGEGPAEDRTPVPVRVSIKSPTGTETVMDTTATFRPDSSVDDRLPLTLNVRVDLSGYAFEQFGVYDVIAKLGSSRAAWRLVVDPAPVSAKSVSQGN